MRASRQVYQTLKMLRECKTILSRHLAANALQLLKKRLPTLSMQQICQHKAIHAAGNCRRALSCDPYMAQMPTPIHPSVPALEFLFFTSENRVVSGRMLANVSPTLWQISIARYTWKKCCRLLEGKPRLSSCATKVSRSFTRPWTCPCGRPPCGPD